MIGEWSVVTAALCLDLVAGDPRGMPHPVVFIGRLITFLEKRIRSLGHNEKLGGCLLLAMTVAITVGIAAAAIQVAGALTPYLGFAAALFIAWTSLAARSLHRESALVAEALQRRDLSEARRYLSCIVGRDTAHLDEPEIWRATIETVAENSSDGVIAPLFYLMIGGPVLAIAYKAVNTLDSMVGYKNDRYLHFGRASARCDDLANWLPARLTGLLMVAAAPLVGLSGKNAFRIMRRDGRNHSSPNSGIPEAAAAGALGVRLGGTSLYGGVPVPKPTIGEAARKPGYDSYRGAVRLMYGAQALLVILWGMVIYLCR